MKVVITGIGAWTAAGKGTDALPALLARGGDAAQEQPPYDGQGLTSPQCAATDVDRERPAEALLEVAVREALLHAGLRTGRWGLVVGTSSGNICGPWERWHVATLAGESADEAGTWRQDPTRVVAERLGFVRHATVSVACASGTAGLTLAQGWLADEVVDAVVVAGVDALSLYVHAGFNGLGALSASRPTPFNEGRDGLLLGEGAAALVLESDRAAWTRDATPLAELAGTGLSADGVHMTAPDREGRGAARAMTAALTDAGTAAADIDLVSVHGTGTAFNDGMEAHALASVFGSRSVAFFGVKQAIGHTLGAAGAIEATVVVDALQTGRVPPAPPAIDPAFPVVVPPRFPPTPTRVLSTNSAFGGVNAAAVITAPGASADLQRPPVEVVEIDRVSLEVPAGKVDWSTYWPTPPDRFKRLNRYVRCGLVAVRALVEAHPCGEETGIVLASRSNCRATDLRYHQKLLQRGAAQAPRVEFIYTIPGAPSGEAAILWGLRGPSMVLCGPFSEAVDEARRLIRWGRATRLIALGVEAPEPRGAATAQAVLLSVRT
ncbi:MAG: hypothetical protein GY884_29975 [Proteobacteria bacterium]|nr:hypothetical protein [Pseudomonadota bacterium]